MSLKDKIIRKLLDFGKKHRLFVYPTLALVAIISAISHGIYWGKGNGKRLVASIMVMVLLFTQSLFLTSSADTPEIATPNYASPTNAEYEYNNDNAEDYYIDNEILDEDNDVPSSDNAGDEEFLESDNNLDDYIDSDSTSSDNNQDNSDIDNSNITDNNDDADNNKTSFDGEDKDTPSSDEDKLKEAVENVNEDNKNNNVFDNEVFQDLDLVGEESIAVDYYLVDSQGEASYIGARCSAVKNEDDDIYTLQGRLTDEGFALAYGTSVDQLNYYSSDSKKTYYDVACTDEIDINNVDIGKLTSSDNKVYIRGTREKYEINYSDELGTQYTTEEVSAIVVTGECNPLVSCTFASDKFHNFGYTFQGIEYNSTKYTFGDSPSVTLSEIKPSNLGAIQIKTLWKPMSFTARYHLAGFGTVGEITAPDVVVANGNDPYAVTYEYGKAVTLPTEAEIDAGNEAYMLVGWYDPSAPSDSARLSGTINDSSVLAKNKNDVTEAVNIEGKDLYAIWEYRNVKLETSGTGATTIENDLAVEISGQYGDYVECFVTAKYRDGSNESNKGTKFDYRLGTVGDTPGLNILNNYGLLGQPVYKSNVMDRYKISGRLINVSPDQEIRIPLEIKDANKDNAAYETYYIVLKINKRPVYIDASSIKSNYTSDPPNKTYDGLNTIAVADRAEVLPETVDGTTSGKAPGDEVYISISDAIAELDNPDAGTGKGITLHGVSLAGAQSGLYSLVNLTGENNDELYVDGVAKVDKKPLTISVEPVEAVSSVYFGQETPSYKIVISNPTDLAGDENSGDEYAYISAVNGTELALENFMVNYLGFTEWETTRKLYSNPGTYSISPKFGDNANKNYSITLSDNSSASFNVVRELARQDVNYTYSTQLGANGYYPGLTISPAGEYDAIRLVDVTELDFDDARTDDEVSRMLSQFESSAVLGDCTGRQVQFQMIDYATGSITTLKYDTLNVDSSVPEYEGHVVSPVIDYFNQFDFGSYYHTQDGIESYNITFTYKAEYSDCDYLHYYFVDDQGTVNGNVDNKVPMTRISGTDKFTGVITLGTNAYGQLVVYATNSTGGMSVSKRIKFAESDNYDSINDYYEWMMENNPIENTSIRVTNMSGTPVVGSSDLWYNGLDYSVVASDDQSGVWKIEWIVTDADGNVTTVTEDAKAETGAVFKEYGKVTSFNFKYSLSDDNTLDNYTVGAKVYDNAGNVTVIDSVGPYKIDCKKPVIQDTTKPSTGDYQSKVYMTFTVSEGNDESGVDKVELYKVDSTSETTGELLSTWAPQDSYSYRIMNNGFYMVKAFDKAGNVEYLYRSFNGVSDVAPSKPVLSIDGNSGNDGYYIEDNPTVHIITPDANTTDGVPVSTTYIITTAASSTQRNIPANQLDDYELLITDNGEIIVEAWSISESGVESEHATISFKVDVEKPEIKITESSTDESGNTRINFLVTDGVSGVDMDSITVNGKKIEVTEVGGTVTGSFETDGSAEYTIKALDTAGNESEDVSFVPLSMTLNPVLDITNTGAYVSAKINKGTYDIADCYIAYRVAGEKTYSTCLSNKLNEDYGIDINFTFNSLKADTVYEFKVYAITKVSKEVAVKTGSFRTATDNIKSATIYGNVGYADALSDNFKTYPVYVSLYSANTYIASSRLDEGDTEYTFKNIADGIYRIVATNGFLSETKEVSIKDGGIVTPADYAVVGGVNFELDGMSTKVIIEDDAIALSVSNLDSVFDTSVSEAIITRADKAVVAEGGTIEVTLHARYLDVSDLSAEEKNIFGLKLGDNTEILRYVDIYVVKEVRNAAGDCVNSTPVRLPELYNPLTISIPLGDLAGQQIYVASVHGSGSEYSFINWGSASEAVISDNFVTITTRFFSVYALYKILPSDKTYKVVWKDGDGNTMKTETVKEGEAATPPVNVPVKSPSDKFTYQFSKWDTDYSKIMSDTIISACFTAHRISKPSEPTTERPTTERPTTERPTTEKPTTEKPTTEKPTTERPTTEKPKTTENVTTEAPRPADIIPPAIDKEPDAYTYLGTADSPKTGDFEPIAVIMVVMLLSGVGVVVLQKKKNE